MKSAKKVTAKKEWFPRQSETIGGEKSSKQKGGKFKRANADVAYRAKGKSGGKKSKRYPRSGGSGSKSQQYDFNRKNKPLI